MLLTIDTYWVKMSSVCHLYQQEVFHSLTFIIYWSEMSANFSLSLRTNTRIRISSHLPDWFWKALLVLDHFWYAARHHASNCSGNYNLVNPVLFWFHLFFCPPGVGVWFWLCHNSTEQRIFLLNLQHKKILGQRHWLTSQAQNRLVRLEFFKTLNLICTGNN